MEQTTKGKAMKTPNLDQVQRVDTRDEMYDFDSGAFVAINDVRSAYVLDLEAAVADERRRWEAASAAGRAAEQDQQIADLKHLLNERVES
jgi:hypothetical protein